MDHDRQVALIRRIFQHLDDGTTTFAEEPHHQPVSHYVDAQRASEEWHRLFCQSPAVAGLSGDVREPGDFLAVDAGDTPCLIIRQRDGSLKAFVNACRHRGSPLAHGRGQCRGGLVCPFHGWGYRPDGRLANIPGAAGFESLDLDGLGLLPVTVRDDLGLIRVFPDSAGNDLRNLGTLAGDLEPLGLGDFHHHRTEYRTISMNWKLVMDTFLETYHFPVLHKASVDSIFMPNCGPFDGFDDHLRLIGVRRTIESLRDEPERNWSLIPHATIVYLIFPATFLILQAGHVELWRIRPARTAEHDPFTTTEFSVSLYAPEEIRSDRARRHWDANLDLLLDVTMSEDFANGARIQKGFRSGQQKSLIFGRNEPALIHFHLCVDRALETTP